MASSIEIPGRREISEFVRRERLTDPVPVYSTLRLVAFLGGYYGLFVAGRVADETAVWLVVWAVQALILEGCQIGVHEAAHGNLYRRRPLNYLSGMVWAVPILFCFPAYRSSHLEHHKNSHVIGRDPEPIYPSTNLVEYLAYLLLGGLVFMGMTLYEGLQSSFGGGADWKRRGNRRTVAALGSLLVIVELGLVVLGLIEAPLLVLELWVVPFVAYGLLSSIVTHPEHTDCAWGPAPPYLSTRFTRSNPVLSFFIWNINLHPAHHLVPSVPGHKLGPLQRKIAPYCAYVNRSYLRWHISYLIGLITRRMTHPPLPVDSKASTPGGSAPAPPMPEVRGRAVTEPGTIRAGAAGRN